MRSAPIDRQNAPIRLDVLPTANSPPAPSQIRGRYRAALKRIDGGLSDMLLGSVAQRVLASAEMPVLLVK